MINNIIPETPLVSVLVATYNQVGVVEETLQSIANQSYKNIEVIISDDCSADGTQAILTCFARDYSHVTLFLQPKNLGITGNYNFLAEKSRGKYVSIFSGDDVMMPDKIDRQVKILEADDKASFCHHAVTVLDYHSNLVGKVITRKYKNNVTTIHDVLRGFGIPGSMSVMYRRAIVNNPVWEPNIAVASDWLQIIKLTMAGQGLYLDDPLCFYRQDGAYNGKDPSVYEADFLNTIEAVRNMYAMSNDVVSKSCDYALRRYSLGAGYRRLIAGDQIKARYLFKTAMLETKLFALALILYGCTFLSVNPEILSRLKKIVRS